MLLIILGLMAGSAWSAWAWQAYAKEVSATKYDHPEIRRVFEGFYFETTEIRYTTTNLRQGKAEVTGELIIMNWEPGAFGGLF